MCSAGFSATTFRIRKMFIKGNQFQVCTKPRIAYDRLLCAGIIIIFSFTVKN
jgi:hypothetical protein